MNGDGRTYLVVGIGEDGWAGLTETARAELYSADVVIGGARQVALVDGHVRAVETWPADLAAAVRALPETHRGRRVAILASGDPMHHGIGTTLVRELGADRVRMRSAPSSISLACARLGWAVERTTVVSAVGRPVAAVRAALHPGARILVLTTEETSAQQVADVAGDAVITVLERLGGPAEKITSGVPTTHDRLAVVAIECGDRPVLSRAPGLPDDAFATDGVFTKQEIRAVTLSALAPTPGQRLWDVGAGSGTVAVEWMRTDPTCAAVAVEPRADRCALIRTNAERLGVPGLAVVEGPAPGALAELAAPDAIFIGGGLTVDGVVDTALGALRPGGRLVANAVTLESEAVLISWHARLGGTLRRLSVAHAEPVGGFTSFRPALPVTQWAHTVTAP